MLIITDGPQTKRFGPYTPLHTLSQSLRSKGVQLYAVGVGLAVDRRELETITGVSKNILLTKTFNKLLRSVNFVGYQPCNCKQSCFLSVFSFSWSWCYTGQLVLKRCFLLAEQRASERG